MAETRNTYLVSYGKSDGKKTSLGDLGVDGRKILKWIVNI
jgi:hypothetical protein